MNVLAIIPARGGSKGVPRKNLRVVAGRPLIAWSIEAALASKRVGLVVVSSDDEEILTAASRYSSQVIAQERPAELATDTAATDPVLVHVVRNLAGYRPDLVVLLQPTVPVRRPGLVDDCIQRLEETRADSLLTAYPLHFVWRRGPVYLSERVPWVSEFNDYTKRPRRQDMDRHSCHWHEDGSVYVTRAEYLLSNGARLGGHVEVLETEHTVDVDTEAELAWADARLRAAKEAVAC